MRLTEDEANALRRTFDVSIGAKTPQEQAAWNLAVHSLIRAALREHEQQEERPRRTIVNPMLYADFGERVLELLRQYADKDSREGEKVGIVEGSIRDAAKLYGFTEEARCEE